MSFTIFSRVTQNRFGFLWQRIALNQRFAYSKVKIENSCGRKSSKANEKNVKIADLFGNEQVNRSDWLNIRNRLMASSGCTQTNIDYFVIDFCKCNKHALENSISYIEFLYEHAIPIRHDLRLKVIWLFVQGMQEENDISTTNSDKIAGLCQSIVSECESLRPFESGLLLEAFSMTREWERAINVIEKYKLNCVASNLNVFSLLTANAFWENKEQIGWKLLESIVQNDYAPQCIAFTAYFDLCKLHRNDNFHERIEQMLDFIGVNEIVVSNEVIGHLQSLLERGSFAFGKINESGKCSRCYQYLDPVRLPDLGYNTLKDALEKSVLSRKTILSSSNMSELIRFKQHVNKKRTFDVIVDGLNASHVKENVTGNALEQSKLVKNIVERFVDKRKRVLVIGRKHMEQKWPEYNWNFIQNNATVFLAADKSDDDRYLLLAAFVSGPRAVIISNDRMRSYIKELPIEHRSLFKQWHKGCSHCVEFDNESQEINIIPAKSFKNYCHKNRKGQWHIPCVAKPSHKPMRHLDKDVKWICVDLSAAK